MMIWHNIQYNTTTIIIIIICSTDTDAELALIKAKAVEAGAVDAVICTHWADGGAVYCYTTHHHLLIILIIYSHSTFVSHLLFQRILGMYTQHRMHV